MSSDSTLPVSVITFGHKHDLNWCVEQEIAKMRDHFDADSAVMRVDLRKTLVNPETKENRVQFRTDGSHSSTIIKVFSQTVFRSVIEKDLTKLIDHAPSVVVAGCTTGYHRADVYGRTLTDSANGLTCGGNKMFAANHFATCGCVNAHEVRQQFKYAIEWVQKPWAATELKTDDTLAYAYKEVLSRPTAYGTFTGIRDAVRRMNEVGVSDNASSDDHDDHDSNTDERRYDDDESEVEVAPPRPTKAQSAKRPTPQPPKEPPTADQRRRPPPPPPPQPSHRGGGQKRARSSYASPPRSSYASPSSHEVKYEVKHRDSLAPHETTTFDVRNWKNVLNEFNVDETATNELFLLSQMSHDGARHANWIISKLLKKKADGQDIYNPSAFVHSAVLKSRYQVTQHD